MASVRRSWTGRGAVSSRAGKSPGAVEHAGGDVGERRDGVADLVGLEARSGEGFPHAAQRDRLVADGEAEPSGQRGGDVVPAHADDALELVDPARVSTPTAGEVGEVGMGFAGDTGGDVGEVLSGHSRHAPGAQRRRVDACLGRGLGPG